MKKILFLVLLITNVVCQAQDISKYRFVAGHPNTDYDFDYDPDYVSVSGILRIDGDSLIEETALSDSAHILFYIRQYPEYDRLFAFSCERDKNSHQQLSATASSKLYVIDTKKNERQVIDIPYSIKENGEDYYLSITTTQFIDLDSTLYMCFHGICDDIKESKSQTGVLFYSLNTTNGKFEKVEPKIYRNVIVDNERLLFRRVSDGMVLKGDTVLNALRIATPKYYGNPIFTDNLPPGIKINPKTAAWAGGGLCLNTNDIMMLSFAERIKREDEFEYQTFRIWNKNTKKWSKMTTVTDDAPFEYQLHYGQLFSFITKWQNIGM